MRKLLQTALFSLALVSSTAIAGSAFLGGGDGTASEWSHYAAASNVNMNFKNIQHAGDIGNGGPAGGPSAHIDFAEFACVDNTGVETVDWVAKLLNTDGVPWRSIGQADEVNEIVNYQCMTNWAHVSAASWSSYAAQSDTDFETNDLVGVRYIYGAYEGQFPYIDMVNYRLVYTSGSPLDFATRTLGASAASQPWKAGGVADEVNEIVNYQCMTNWTRVSAAAGYLPSAATTTCTVDDVWYPLGGVFSNNVLTDFELDVDKLKYTGSATKTFILGYAGTFTSASAGFNLYCSVSNSVPLGQFMSGTYLKNNDHAYHVSGYGAFEMAPNDTVQLVIKSDVASKEAECLSFNTSLHAVSH